MSISRQFTESDTNGKIKETIHYDTFFLKSWTKENCSHCWHLYFSLHFPALPYYSYMVSNSWNTLALLIKSFGSFIFQLQAVWSLRLSCILFFAGGCLCLCISLIHFALIFFFYWKCHIKDCLFQIKFLKCIAAKYKYGASPPTLMLPFPCSGVSMTDASISASITWYTPQAYIWPAAI